MNIPPQAIIIGIGIILILYIILRKFPILASIDTESIPKDMQQKLKKNLYADRLQRKLKERTHSLKLVFVPLFRVMKKVGVMSYKHIRDLGTQYRLRKKQGHLPDSPNFAERDILVEAEELFHEGKLKQAEEAYITLIEHNPKNIDAYEGLAEVYLGLKDYEHGEEVLSYIVKLKEHVMTDRTPSGSEELTPQEGKMDLAARHFELGEVHERNGEKAHALRCFKEAVRLDKKNPKYLDRLLDVSLELGNVLLASKTLDTLKTINPENSKIPEWEHRIKTL